MLCWAQARQDCLPLLPEGLDDAIKLSQKRHRGMRSDAGLGGASGWHRHWGQQHSSQSTGCNFYKASAKHELWCVLLARFLEQRTHWQEYYLLFQGWLGQDLCVACRAHNSSRYHLHSMSSALQHSLTFWLILPGVQQLTGIIAWNRSQKGCCSLVQLEEVFPKILHPSILLVCDSLFSAVT